MLLMHLTKKCIKPFDNIGILEGGGGGSPQPPPVCSIHLDDLESF